MEAPDNEVDALRAEVLRLKELMAVKDQLLAAKDEIIASKMEVVACKEALLSRTAEELQQCKSASRSKPAAAAENRIEQPCSKRRRLHTGSCCEVASPLDNDGIFDLVLSYVGGGEHLYIGGVSRCWRGRYMQHCAKHSASAHDKKLSTTHRSVLVSAGRLQLAISSGLAVAGWTFETLSRAELVCKYSLEPQQVLTLLRLQGVPWSTALCDMAARSCNLPLLQWLRASSCPWRVSCVLGQASRGGSVLLLEWLHTVTEPWPAIHKSKMLARAGWNNHLAAAKWLRAQGAEWPPKFAGHSGDRGCWSLSTVQWAVASDSGWLDWRCQDYADAIFKQRNAKEHAAAVLKWAHANGCPCTCEQQHQQQQQQQQQQVVVA
jgi:hypothetical protein